MISDGTHRVAQGLLGYGVRDALLRILRRHLLRRHLLAALQETLTTGKLSQSRPDSQTLATHLPRPVA